MYGVIGVGFLLVNKDNSIAWIQSILQAIDQCQDRILVAFCRIWISNLSSVNFLISLSSVWILYICPLFYKNSLFVRYIATGAYRGILPKVLDMLQKETNLPPSKIFPWQLYTSKDLSLHAEKHGGGTSPPFGGWYLPHFF